MLSQGTSHTGRTRGSDWPASARYLPTRSHQIHKVPPGPTRPLQAPPGPSTPLQAPPGPSRPLQAPPGPARWHQIQEEPRLLPQQSSSEASDEAHPWPHTGRSWRVCACEGHSLHLSGRGLSQSSSVWSCRVSDSRVCVALATSRTQNLSRRYQSKSRTVLLASHPRLLPVLPAPQVDIQALLDQGVGIAPHAPGDHAGCAGQTSPSSLLICKVEATAPGHCLPEDKEIVTKISAPSPPMLNRNRETEFGRNRVALLLFPEEEHGRLAPQELCPLPGDHKEPSRWNS